MEKLKNNICEIFYDRGIWIIIIGWLIFTYLWRENGDIGWEAKIMFDNGWLKESIGHFTAGIGIAFSWIYSVRKFGKKLDAFTRIEPIQFLFSILFIATVWAVFWEGYEAIRDILRSNEPGFVPAQTSGADTTLDIFITWLGAIFGYEIYRCARYYREKLYPEEACDDITEKIENAAQHLHDLSIEYHKNRRAIKKERDLKKTQAKWKNIKKILRNIFYSKKPTD